jgi:hypothetical protein
MELGHWRTGGGSIQDWCLGNRSSVLAELEEARSEVGVWEFLAGVGCAGKFSTLCWTTEDGTIVTAFTFATEHPKTIYEFNSSRLETVQVGTPFEGRTHCHISGLAVSIDCVLLASASCQDNTIKLWAFESRQLLASFDRVATNFLVLSPDSRQIAYTTHYGPPKIYTCNIPPETVDSIWPTRQTHGV